ncbi:MULTISPECIES: DUF3397 domain-containing protein [Sutcliffiella]|uniref:DUF3397 domain-containing protein n=1 Tax=Sutcliffiella cohnii TaxID=33932 RepID=A0A223KS61_9BACI|nr:MULTISPECIES: DUF3397 domain-containing protein [Sutcliffiella]AST92153.1 hypothetical protein BC6307_13100 [Sutcliffiella cohnii]WBL13385.1 DUF3397 domain-containing protein [Sutcliffiella sp. NC1]
MSNMVASIIATFVTIPIFTWFLLYFISRSITKNNKRSFQMATDYSTFFFILAVHYLIVIIWDRSLLWLILIVLIIIATVIVLVHYRINQEIKFRKVWKGFWRTNFLLFFFLYFSLAFFGLIKRMTELFSI